MNAKFFKAQVNSDLFKDYNLVAVDLPGHGMSSKLDDYSIPNLLEVLYSNIKDLDHIILVGHSLGGHLATRLLPKLKERCLGICLIGCPPLQIPLNIEDAYVLNEKSAMFLQKDLSSESIHNLVDLIYNSKDAVFSELINSFKNTDGSFREGFAKSLITEGLHDEFQILSQFKGSILMVYGAQDKVINLDYINRLTLKSAKKVILRNLGHSPHFEDSLEFNMLLLNFIQALHY